MKNTLNIILAICLFSMVLPMAGCDGDMPTKAIPRTEDKMNDYALTQIYMVPIASDSGFDADQFKTQIDALIGQYGEDEVIEKIKEIATTHDDTAYRVAAVFSIQPYVGDLEFETLADDALDEQGRKMLDEQMR